MVIPLEVEVLATHLLMIVCLLRTDKGDVEIVFSYGCNKNSVRTNAD